ncbi:MAG: hypothetical protein ACOY3P_00665 [Planctomycetota bacterium]
MTDAPPLDYRRLNPDRIEETIDRLGRRIRQRFPGSNLGSICSHLFHVADHTRERAAWIARPVLPLRIGVWALVVLIVLACVAGLSTAQLDGLRLRFVEMVQLIESAVNDIVFIGIAIFFLLTLETRIKRRRALAAISELRAIIHIIDMHQLTKDPERLRSPGMSTTDSPKETLSVFELRRYLSYCSEMLSLAAKIAALYVQDFDDGVVIAAANEVEELSTGLSRKIWQKIMLLQDGSEPTDRAARAQ